MADYIRIEIDKQGIATVTLDRVDVHNAFDDQFINQLSDCWQHLSEDDRVRVVIIQAAGKHFCAGADLKWMQRSIDATEQENEADAIALATMLKKLNTLNKPTIAQVHGAVMGGGGGIVACCDIVIASDDAKFCFSEVKLGLIPATIGPYVLAKIGVKACRRYFLTAELFNAETAQQLNLVDEVVRPDTLANRTRELAMQIRKNGPAALAACKQLILNLSQADNENILNETAQCIARIRTSPEAQHGLHAFFDKQPPSWIGEQCDD